MTYHDKEGILTVQELKSNELKGLKLAEVEKRQVINGKNEIKDEKKRGLLSMFFSQFKDLMIVILLVSALVSVVVSYISEEKEYYDFIIILSIVVTNGIIGTVQEYKAEKAIDALKKITSPSATVIRDGKKKNINSLDLVVGDIVLVSAGQIAPADIRILESVELTSEESSLTGESMPREKNGKVVLNKNTPVSEMKNMLFQGCTISSGHGRGIVTAIGMDTQIGRIANLLQTEQSPQTPLQKKLNQTGKMLGIAVLAVCMIIFVLGLFKNIPALEMLLIAISLAVAAIPEGLTAVVTIVLSMGVKRMVKNKAIVRKLPSVETLGSVSVICSDKTGTLTQNKMTVVETANLTECLKENCEERRLILGLASLCNNSEKTNNGYIGMPTEIAIVKAFENEVIDFKNQFPRIGEIPFTSKRKLMTTVHKSGESFLVVTKGAPDYLLKLCTHVMHKGNKIEINKYYTDIILDINKKMSNKALRVLAVAKKECDNINVSDNEIENGLTFCGLIGIEDPPRKEAKRAVEKCKKSGIKPVMITGDQVGTALAIAKKIGIYNEHTKYMTGQTLSTINETELAKIINQYSVFARVTPEDKVKIVKAFQKNKELVAMTGDGINDAPALKSADIGCAMGKNGTEVAKSSADMILTDDNFATIVEAVREGRGIFVNIRKTIHFLLSCNMGEIILIFIAFLFGLPVPLLATQILWVNLVTDSFPALALGAGKSPKDIMDKPFKGNSIMDFNMCFSMVIEGAFIGVMALIAFIVGRNFFDIDPQNPIIGRTMCLAVLCLSQLVHSFNVSSEHSLFSSKREKNKWLPLSAAFCGVLLAVVIIFPGLNIAFKTTALTTIQWVLVGVFSFIPLFVAEIEKLTSFLFIKSSK